MIVVFRGRGRVAQSIGSTGVVDFPASSSVTVVLVKEPVIGIGHSDPTIVGEGSFIATIYGAGHSSPSVIGRGSNSPTVEGLGHSSPSITGEGSL